MAVPSIEDRLAIGDLFVRYTTALDECDIDRVVSCFTTDCTLVSPIHGAFHGHDGIRKFAAPNVKLKERGAQFRHFISNLVIDQQGDRAKAYCYLLDFVTVDGKTELLSPGVYDCDLMKQGGEWRMKQRLVNMDYKFTLPPAEKPKAKTAKKKAEKKPSAKKSKTKKAAKRSAKKSARRARR